MVLVFFCLLRSRCALRSHLCGIWNRYNAMQQLPTCNGKQSSAPACWCKYNQKRDRRKRVLLPRRVDGTTASGIDLYMAKKRQPQRAAIQHFHPILSFFCIFCLFVRPTGLVVWLCRPLGHRWSSRVHVSRCNWNDLAALCFTGGAYFSEVLCPIAGCNGQKPQKLVKQNCLIVNKKWNAIVASGVPELQPNYPLRCMHIAKIELVKWTCECEKNSSSPLPLALGASPAGRGDFIVSNKLTRFPPKPTVLPNRCKI